MGKNLTVRYSITQFTYWVTYSGATGFATTYLLGAGMSSGLIGVLLALAGILACFTQPILAAIADRAKTCILPQMILVISALCCLCFGMQLIPGIPLLLAGILYILGIWSSDAILPLLNALSVACNNAGYPTDFCAARGIGGIGSAAAALALGYIIAKFGNTWMFLFLIIFRLICAITILGYPKPDKVQIGAVQQTGNCSILQFFTRYKWYCLSLLGIAFVAMEHSMEETYMISIMERLGGDSSHVGVALFIAAMTASPVIFFFSHIRKRIKDTALLKVAGVSFLIRATLLYFAGSIGAVYAVQFIQLTSYAFLGPTQVYFADAKVNPADMVKGQAFMTAAFALGCSCGNFIGGQALTFGVDTMLLAGIITAGLGCIMIFLTVNKEDSHAAHRI